MELSVPGCVRAGAVSAQPSSDGFMFLPARHAPETVLRNGYVTCFSRFASAGQCHRESNPESVARVKPESSTEGLVRASFWWRVRLKFAQDGSFISCFFIYSLRSYNSMLLQLAIKMEDVKNPERFGYVCVLKRGQK